MFMCTTAAVAMFGLKVPNRRKYVDFRPWRYSRRGAGPESQSMLCSDSILHSASDDSQRFSNSELSWKAEGTTASGKLPLLKYGHHQQSAPLSHQRDKEKLLQELHHHRHHHHQTNASGKAESAIRDRSRSLTGLSNHNNCVASTHAPRGESDGARLDRRMNTNGLDRSAMTGSSSTTSENLTWLADVAVCQAQPTAQRPVPAIITSIAAAGSAPSHDQHSMLSAGSASLFRPPLTLSDPAQRFYSSGQYAPIYTTTGSSLSYSPSLYSAHGQSTISPYSAFYHHYPHGYSTALLSHYPHIDPSQSYSAVLASMGSHVQHAAQSQLPRSPFLPGHLPQHYSTLTPTNSPGPGSSIPRSLTPVAALTSSQGQGHHMVDSHRHDTKSPHKSEHRHIEGGRPLRTMSPGGRDIKHGPHHGHSSPHHPKAGVSMLKEPPSSPGKDSGFKSSVMSGKEGSRKHRLLTRTPESEGYFLEPKHLPFKSDEPSSKRMKGIGNPPPLHPSHHPHPAHHHHHGGGGGMPPSGGAHLPPPPPLHPAGYPVPPSHPHYPPHFMRGSIIQLASGDLKRVEDLRTDDFVSSADVSGDLKIDSSTVVRIEENTERGTALLGFSVGQHRVQVTVEATLEHPFFVFGQGWSSCQPERTSQRYGLSCQKLSVGDVCISLTHKDVNSRAAELGAQQRALQQSASNQISGGTSGTPSQQSTATSAASAAHESLVPGEAARRHKLEPLLPSQGQVTSAGKANVTAEPGAIHPRKRRWSAPDQISVESPDVNRPSTQPATDPTTSTGQGQGQMGHSSTSSKGQSHEKGEEEDATQA